MRAGSNWRHLNGLSLGMMGDPVRCLPKVVHPDVAALKLQHNPIDLPHAAFADLGGDGIASYALDSHLIRPETDEVVASSRARA